MRFLLENPAPGCALGDYINAVSIGAGASSAAGITCCIAVEEAVLGEVYARSAADLLRTRGATRGDLKHLLAG